MEMYTNFSCRPVQKPFQLLHHFQCIAQQILNLKNNAKHLLSYKAHLQMF